MLFKLFVLSLDIHLMLELRTISSQIGSTAIACAKIELGIEAAHTDCSMAFGAQVEFVLNLTPGFLEGIGLFSMPLRTIYLLTSFSGTSPKTTKESHANIHDIGRSAHRGANRPGVYGPVTL